MVTGVLPSAPRACLHSGRAQGSTFTLFYRLLWSTITDGHTQRNLTVTRNEIISSCSVLCQVPGMKHVFLDRQIPGINELHGRQIPGVYDLHGLQVTRPGKSRIIRINYSLAHNSWLDLHRNMSIIPGRHLSDLDNLNRDLSHV